MQKQNMKEKSSKIYMNYWSYTQWKIKMIFFLKIILLSIYSSKYNINYTDENIMICKYFSSILY